MIKVDFSGQVPKDLSFPESLEDEWCPAPDAGRVAISDGASESFDSRRWARHLVEHFIRRPQVDCAWLDDLLVSYADGIDHQRLTWSQQAALERGSFATLLGLVHRPDREILDIVGVGDSLAVFLDGEERVDSFPYSRASEFAQRPELFCTIAKLNGFLQSPEFPVKHHRAWCIHGRTRPVVYCMTDALGEWALRREEEGHPIWARLAKIRSQSDFQDLIIAERAAGSMRTDDSTLVRLSFESRGGT